MIPHLLHPQILNMGLSLLDSTRWINVDDAWPAYHRNACQLLATRDDTWLAEADSITAQQEFAHALIAHLRTQPALAINQHCVTHRDSKTEIALDDYPPLLGVALCVQDDLILMQKRQDQYCLSAASLATPSSWSLPEKIGRPIREIHDPIPGFHGALSDKIDRFFDHLRPEHPVERWNWSLQWGECLALFPGESQHGALHYRTERQTLRRLPRSGAIAFTVRVYIRPAHELGYDALLSLREAMHACPAPLWQYKQFGDYAPAVEALLASAHSNP